MTNKTPKIEEKRHSLAHLLAIAVLEKFPEAKLGIGPVIENGFYYDFELPSSLKNEDLPELEKRMRELAKEDLVFKKEKITFPSAKKLFKDQPYKLELINEFHEQKKPLSIYKTFSGKSLIFADLCAGPHVKSTGDIDPKSFKLTRTAGAYWRGSEKNKMLTRIYGAAFETEKELTDYLKRQEEIVKRDHRILGEKLDLFMIDEKIGKGLPIWLPKGYFIRHLIEDYIYNLEEKNGYLHVLTPQLAKEELYQTSGHLAHYREDMYAPIKIEEETYYLKPMNCPHHHSIYKHKTRSYRDLPLRIAEFGTVYRYERSGVLSGLIRVRGFTQNDAHIYTTPEGIENEIVNILKMHKKVYDDFKIYDYWFRLSLPDFKNKEKFGDTKDKKTWENASDILRQTLKKMGLNFVEALGEASFYGPKIDIQIKDIHGKEDTIATIQVDFYSAPKFDLTYIDKEGKEQPPVIIHRAILGSFERFFAFLIEKTAGKFPLWLAPIQAKIINISEKQLKYAEEVLKRFKESGIRAELDKDNATLGKRIREAETQKIPYILVIGEKEAANKNISIRHFERGQEGEMKVAELIEKMRQEIENKS
ncbi:MAG: threonine--tRNA ligase [Patescibacteria group bacterium]|nr:threonine--tRNA ligase [Patescibacteria group bacterium]